MPDGSQIVFFVCEGGWKGVGAHFTETEQMSRRQEGVHTPLVTGQPQLTSTGLHGNRA